MHLWTKLGEIPFIGFCDTLAHGRTDPNAKCTGSIKMNWTSGWSLVTDWVPLSIVLLSITHRQTFWKVALDGEMTSMPISIPQCLRKSGYRTSLTVPSDRRKYRGRAQCVTSQQIENRQNRWRQPHRMIISTRAANVYASVDFINYCRSASRRENSFFPANHFGDRVQ